MSRRGLIAGLALAAGLAVVVLFGHERAARDGPVADKAPQETGGIVRHAFLEGLDLSEDNPGYALLLHPMATGEGLRAVTDPDALRRAQGTAFYTDDPGRAAKLLLLSVVFMSPPGKPPDSLFVTVLRQKEVLETYRCHPAYCNGTYETETPHTRDMAGLLEASLPVTHHDETFRHHDLARAAHFRLLNDPAIVRIDPPDLPPPGTLVYPARVVLSLPVLLIETEADGQTPLVPFDEAEFTARFTAAFEHVFEETEAYRMGPIRTSTHYPPQQGWPVVSEEIEGPLRTNDGTPRGIDRYLVIEPEVTLDLMPDMARRLLEPGAFAAMPAFTREPDSLRTRLDALAEEALSAPCPGCLRIELPVTTVGDIHARRAEPQEFFLSYYRVVTP